MIESIGHYETKAKIMISLEKNVNEIFNQLRYNEIEMIKNSQNENSLLTPMSMKISLEMNVVDTENMSSKPFEIFVKYTLPLENNA